MGVTEHFFIFNSQGPSFLEVAPCKEIRILDLEIFACGIRNPELCNPEVPLNRNPQYATWNLESTPYNPESKTGLITLHGAIPGSFFHVSMTFVSLIS